MGHVLDAVGDTIDIVKIGDDLGTQQSLLMSPAMYRSMLKPIHAELHRLDPAADDGQGLLPHRRRRLPAARRPRRDRGRHPEPDPDLGRQDGRPRDAQAALWRRPGRSAAAIDTQRVLPHGTPDEVTAEVRRVIGELGAGRRLPAGLGPHDHERRAGREHPGDGRRGRDVRALPGGDPMTRGQRRRARRRDPRRPLPPRPPRRGGARGRPGPGRARPGTAPPRPCCSRR